MKKSIPVTASNMIAEMMDTILDKNAPEGARSGAFFTLLDIKQDMIDKQLFEMAGDFKKIEDWNDCPIPFNDLKGDVVLVKE